jgi:ribosomal 50S subunit-associated protein YjgA (DUF615 family)
MATPAEEELLAAWGERRDRLIDLYDRFVAAFPDLTDPQLRTLIDNPQTVENYHKVLRRAEQLVERLARR